MNNYNDYLNRKQAEYGDKFDPSDLAPQFIYYYENQARIEVKMSYGEVKRGRVGITTGWKPEFLLMARVDSSGSSETLGKNNKILSIINLK